MEPEKTAAAVTVREIPIALWRQLKVRAAVEGTTVQATVAKAIEHYLKTA
jgi:plasmid stability protein